MSPRFSLRLSGGEVVVSQGHSGWSASVDPRGGAECWCLLSTSARRPQGGVRFSFWYGLSLMLYPWSNLDKVLLTNWTLSSLCSIVTVHQGLWLRRSMRDLVIVPRGSSSAGAGEFRGCNRPSRSVWHPVPWGERLSGAVKRRAAWFDPFSTQIPPSFPRSIRDVFLV